MSWIKRSELLKNKKNLYKKGSCENCGSETHTKKSCFERPRKLGAKFTNKITKENSFEKKNKNSEKEIFKKNENKFYKNNYEKKRDNWKNYDLEDQKRLYKEYNIENEIKSKLGISEKNSEFIEKIEIEKNEKEEDTRKRTFHSFRNRETIPNYLKDFEKKNPNEKNQNSQNLTLDKTGEALDFLEQEKFVYNQIKKNKDFVNSVALPTATEIFYKNMLEEKKNLKNEEIKLLEEKYSVSGKKKEDRIRKIKKFKKI